MPICIHIRNRSSLSVQLLGLTARPRTAPPKKGAEYSSHPRERWFRCVRSLILVWLSVTSFQGFAAAPEVKEAELKQIQGRIESVRKAIQSDAERRDALTKDLRAADLRIQSARERLTDVRAQRADAEGQLAALRDEKSKTQQQVDAQREALSAELAAPQLAGKIKQDSFVVHARLAKLQTQRARPVQSQATVALLLMKAESGAMFAMAEGRVVVRGALPERAEAEAVQAAARSAMKRVSSALR